MFVWVEVFAWLVWLSCACGVRRLYDLRRVCPSFSSFLLLSSLFLLSSCSCPASLLGFCSWSCPLYLYGLFLAFLPLGLLFPFPFRMYTQKERAQRFVPCVLSCPVVGLLWVYYMLSAFLRVDSFVFENIHPAPQVRWALNLPPRVFKMSLIARVSPTIATAFSE